MSGPRIQAVIVDLDDTLFDHQESARRGLSRLVDELGGTLTPQVAAAWGSMAEQLTTRLRAGDIGRAEYRRLRIRHLLTRIERPAGADAVDDARCDRLYARFLEAYEEEWVGFADAVPTLRALHDLGLPVAILTNGPEERQQRKVRALGLDPWVVGVWTSERLGVRKPDPATYLAVCTELGADPGTVLHVGDDLENDLRGALAAGLPALHLDRQRRVLAGSARIAGLDEVLGRV